jgi:DNA-binding NtrC family response regulator
MDNKTVEHNDRILIVDDDPSVTDFLLRFLKQKGYQEVQAVDTGQKALELLKTGKDIKLIFLDVKLPGMDGIEVLRKIKELNKDAGVIMITGFPDEEIAKRAMKEGAFDYIIKPFDLAYLELSMLTKIVMMK